MVVEKTIQKIPVKQFALMIACICGVMGVIMGIFCGVVFAAGFHTMVAHPLIRIIFGVAAIILIPIMAFIGGLIHGAIIAYIYNFLAPRIGGIKIQFKEDNLTTNTA
jgi:hypothetical protein